MKEEAIIPPYVKTINITNPEAVKLICEEAFLAQTGGKSHIHKNHIQRMAMIKEDQLTGQAGNFALNFLIFNDKEKTIEFYKKSRDLFHINPKDSDNGMDIIDSHIDIKNSFSLHRALYSNNSKRMRDVSQYRLPVRPKEMHPDWIYVSALTEEMNENLITVHIIGWARTSDFPETTEKGGTFDGCHTIRNYNIRTLPVPNIFPAYLQPYLRKGVVEGV